MSERTFFTRLFFSPAEPRLRAGWRILLQLLLMAALVVAFSGILGLLIAFFPELPPALVAIANQVVIVAAITVSVYFARHRLDRRSFASLGLEWNARAVKDLLAGFAIAGLMLGLVFLVEWAGGWLRFEGFAWQQEAVSRVALGVLVELAIFLTVGWYEELLTRGYWLKNLADGLGLRWAVILSSSVFALVHLMNPNASLTILIGLTAAGLFFACAAVWSRQLWLPVGLHIGWNFFEGPVFGFPVSGVQSFTLVHQTVSGPEWITGGAFGPEAGAVLLAALGVGFGLIYGYSRWARQENTE
jgi:membrane protease YdiL (CAAX protease family)